VRTIVKKTTLSIAATAAVLIAASSAGFAAELPTYQVAGFPISPVQAQVLERANVHEQVPTSAISPHQLNAPAPRKKVANATGTPAQTAGSSLR
jgi:multisubunit Na+/H+ antiporter MnhG subunit